MKMTDKVKPISYLKSNAAEIARTLHSQGPLIITQNGEAKIVVQDIDSYEQTQETLALLKILALGRRQADSGDVLKAQDVFEALNNDI